MKGRYARHLARAEIMAALPIAWCQISELAYPVGVCKKTIRAALADLEAEGRIKTYWVGHHKHKLLRVEPVTGAPR